MEISAPASGRQIAKGAAWLMLFKIADKSVGLVSTLILARLLVPADFGLVAMATSVVALTQLMGAFGFDSALIQRQDCRREHYDTAWTFSVLFGVVIAGVLASLAVPAATFYREDRLTLILLALAFGALVGGFENVGTVAFRKELNFRSEFRFLLLKRLVAFVVTISLALTFQTYWALVAGVVSSRVAAVWISYRLHPYRPRLSMTARADLLHFSKWILISNLVDFMHVRSTDFILGRTVGTHGLGIYNVASEIATMPSTELVSPLNRAVYPAYSRLAATPDQLFSRFLEVFGVICIIVSPIAVGLFCVVDPLVRVVLGNRWLEAIPLIKLFAIHGLVSALRSNMYLVLLSLGKPRLNTLLSAALLLLSLPLVVWASLNHGMFGAALAQITVSVAALVGITTVLTRVTGVRVVALLGKTWRPFLAAVVMGCIAYGTERWFDTHLPDALSIWKLFTLAAVCVLSYPATIALLWFLSGHPQGAEQAVFTMLSQKTMARRHGLRRAN